MPKRHDTARDAVANLEGKVKDGQLSSVARKLQRQRRIREQETYNRNERIRRAREAQGPDGGDAA